MKIIHQASKRHLLNLNQREKMEELLQFANSVDAWYGEYMKDTNDGDTFTQEIDLRQLRQHLRGLQNRLTMLKELGVWG